METIAAAKKAKKALDGEQRRGRNLKVRLAPHPAALKVKHLHGYVSNEMLKEAFESFGEIEKAVVVVDDKGRPTGDGVVEFARKPGATMALNRIIDGVFLMGNSPRPISVEPLQELDSDDGFPEIFLNKQHPDYQKEREGGARFAQIGSFEYEFAQKWKEMYAMHQEAEENLKRQFQENVMKLEIEQANAQMEYQTQKLREDLLRRQDELRKMEEQHQREVEMRMEMRRQQDENRSRMEEIRKHEQEERSKQQEMYERERQQRMREMQEMQHNRELRQMNQQHAMQLREMRQSEQQQGRGREGGDDLDNSFGNQRGRHSMDGMRGRQSLGDDAAPLKPPPAPPALLGLQRGRGSMGEGRSSMGGGNEWDQQHGGYENNDNGYEQRGMGQRMMVDKRGGHPGGADDYFENKRARRF